ncbi:MAG: 3-oxoacyl-[acyl-carrier-protein] reductase [Planctomycetes bacterium]|nr:3-oxoacyl-[acyl-carrier-protein] reductase [Planctomycetota bacterium]
MILAAKVALVTGASRGIGRAIARAFASEGAKVAVVYNRSPEPAEKLVQEIAQKGGEAVAFQADVKDFESAQKIVQQTIDKWGQLDILVNNAGVIRDKLFVTMEPDDWNEVVHTNLGGAFNFSRAAGVFMMRARRGKIINISSVAGEFGGRGQVNYAASKGAINAMTRSLAAELAPRNVNINAIAPGLIETEMSETVRNLVGEEIKKIIPLKRCGKPEEIAALAVFLASPAADYITGQVITIDGGLSLGGIR